MSHQLYKFKTVVRNNVEYQIPIPVFDPDKKDKNFDPRFAEESAEYAIIESDRNDSFIMREVAQLRAEVDSLSRSVDRTEKPGEYDHGYCDVITVITKRIDNISAAFGELLDKIDATNASNNSTVTDLALDDDFKSSLGDKVK